MRDELAPLFYESAEIGVQGGELNVELTMLLKRPGWLRTLSSYITREIDEYAIDSLSSTSDTLPYATMCASDLGFPIQWVRQNKITEGTNDVRRTILLTSITPQEEEINSFAQLFSSAKIELVGIYSLLGIKEPNTSIRLLNLIPLKDVLSIYQRLYLIEPEVYETLMSKLA